MKIETKGSDGKINGYLVPIWNVLDGPPVDQVYLTVISPFTVKGPHLHMKRRGLFKVILGTVHLVIRTSQGVYISTVVDEEDDPIPVSPGVPAALYNEGDGFAYVLNMPSPAWRPDDQDEHEVKNWEWSFSQGKGGTK
jgi:hypothetical protein